MDISAGVIPVGVLGADPGLTKVTTEFFFKNASDH